jgi:hypothetical protein
MEAHMKSTTLMRVHGYDFIALALTFLLAGKIYQKQEKASLHDRRQHV